MLLQRRTPPGWMERVRVWLWPRRSWSRSLRYVLLRILRLRTSPHALAMGCAAGVFVSCTPLIGGQIVLAALLAYALRASVPAAMLATFFGNPLSWPLIWIATYFTGAQMLGDGTVAAAQASELPGRIDGLWQALLGQSPEMIAAAASLVWPLFVPMLAGSVPVGLAAAIAIYYTMRHATQALAVRRKRLPEALQAVDGEEGDAIRIYA